MMNASWLHAARCSLSELPWHTPEEPFDIRSKVLEIFHQMEKQGLKLGKSPEGI